MNTRGARVRAGLVIAAVAAVLAGSAGCSAGSTSDDASGSPGAPTTTAAEPSSAPPPTSLDPSDLTDPSESTTTSAPATKTPDEPKSITVVMNGDMLLHEGLWSSAEINSRRTGRGPDGMDFRPILADMRPVVSHADLAICHMETPVAPHGGPYSGYPLFSAPPAILPALKWLGYDVCTTASNHSIDQGFEGLKRTIDDFERVGIAHAGTAETQRASRQPLLMDVARRHGRADLGDVRHERAAAARGPAVVGAPDRHRPDRGDGAPSQATGRRHRDGGAALGAGVHARTDDRPARGGSRADQGPGHQLHLRTPRARRAAVRRRERAVGRLRPRQRSRAAGHRGRGCVRREHRHGSPSPSSRTAPSE